MNLPTTQDQALLETTGESLKTKLKSRELSEETKEYMRVVRVASAHYSEALSSNPYYAARKNDENFWFNFVGSRYLAARDMVYRFEGRSIPVDE